MINLTSITINIFFSLTNCYTVFFKIILVLSLSMSPPTWLFSLIVLDKLNHIKDIWMNLRVTIKSLYFFFIVFLFLLLLKWLSLWFIVTILVSSFDNDDERLISMFSSSDILKTWYVFLSLIFFLPICNHYWGLL